MDDWSKTLLSTTAGFVAGLAAEPLKLWIGRMSQRRYLQTALYDELVQTCGKMAAIVQFASSQDQDASLLWGLKTLEVSPIKVDVFDHYYEKHRDVVYSLPEVRWLVHIYKVIIALNEISDDPPRAKVVEIEKVLRHTYVVAVDADLPAPSLKRLAKHWLEQSPERQSPLHVSESP
jgi:hypothetical protein